MMRVGLSPRVRGNPDRVATREDRIGSIPACTGEPKALVRAHHPGKVYPRVYGGTMVPLSFGFI